MAVKAYLGQAAAVLPSLSWLHVPAPSSCRHSHPWELHWYRGQPKTNYPFLLTKINFQMAKLLNQLPFWSRKHPTEVGLHCQAIAVQGDVVYSTKDLLCGMKDYGSESSQRQELCSVWVALSCDRWHSTPLPARTLNYCPMTCPACWVVSLPSVCSCGPLIHVQWAWTQEKHVPQPEEEDWTLGRN